MKFNLNNYTGHVITKRGVKMLVEAIEKLHSNTKTNAMRVKDVPCMDGNLISVMVDSHGNATKM